MSIKKSNPSRIKSGAQKNKKILKKVLTNQSGCAII
jgi:hypothetical protein